MSSFKLSDRLMAAAECVAEGRALCKASGESFNVADVGCDHAFLAIHLAEQGIADRCIASDVRQGPLAAAREHVDEAGLCDRINIVLSDGVKGVELERVDCLCILGMGGRLMTDILEAGGERISKLSVMVLSPQSEPELVRACVMEKGLHIESERTVYEDGKYYTIMTVLKGEESLPYKRHELLFGRALSKRDAGVEKARLEAVLERDRGVRERLVSLTGESATDGLKTVEDEIKELEAALTDIDKIKKGDRDARK